MHLQLHWVLKMETRLPPESLEKTYELFARVIDEVGPDREIQFLSRLCLTLASAIDKYTVIEQAVAIAKKE